MYENIQNMQDTDPSAGNNNNNKNNNDTWQNNVVQDPHPEGLAEQFALGAQLPSAGQDADVAAVIREKASTQLQRAEYDRTKN